MKTTKIEAFFFRGGLCILGVEVQCLLVIRINFRGNLLHCFLVDACDGIVVDVPLPGHDEPGLLHGPDFLLRSLQLPFQGENLLDQEAVPGVPAEAAGVRGVPVRGVAVLDPAPPGAGPARSV